MTGLKLGGSGRNSSYRIQPTDVPAIKKPILTGELFHRIAPDYDVNPGRIAEIKKGHRYADIPPAR